MGLYGAVLGHYRNKERKEREEESGNGRQGGRGEGGGLLMMTSIEKGGMNGF